MTDVLIKWEIWIQRQICIKEDSVKRHRETAIYEPRKEAWNKSFLHRPLKVKI